MGSDSDLPVMKDAARILNMFGVPYEVDHLIIKFYFLVYFNSTLTNYNMQVKIVSAHRTPEMMFSYASSALKYRFEYIIVYSCYSSG